MQAEEISIPDFVVKMYIAEQCGWIRHKSNVPFFVVFLTKYGLYSPGVEVREH